MSTPAIARVAAQRQLDAYNARDIDAFVACYAEDVVVTDLPSGQVRLTGRAALRRSYAEMFARSPDLKAVVTNRSTVGNFVFDREVVTGRGDTALHAMAIYEVGADGLIARVFFVTQR